MDPEAVHGLSGRDAAYESLQGEKERLLCNKAAPHLLYCCFHVAVLTCMIKMP